MSITRNRDRLACPRFIMNTILNGIAFSHAFVCAGVVAVSVMIPAGRGQAEPAAAQVAVRVRTDQPGSPIPDDFLGFSCEKKILSHLCFEPANTQLINLFHNLGHGVLRIGGDEVDHTGWSLSETNPLTGMEENRFSRQLTTLGPRSLDNLYGFARQSGWQVIHGLNLGANDPAMAADEAVYALRVGGTSVLAFEVGNEPNLFRKSRNDEGLRPASYGFAQYRQEVEAYDAAILSRLPQAPLAGPATTKTCKWFPDYLAEFKNRLVLTTSHVYPLSAKDPDPKSPRFPTVENLLSSRLAEQSERLDWLPQLQASRAAGRPFRLGECNTASGGGKRGVSDAFASALWGVDFLFSVAEQGGAGINFHGGFTAGNYAPIWYRKSDRRYLASPLYYSMLLFHQAGRGRVVPVECPPEESFSAHAVLGDDHRLRVVLNNKNQAQPLIVSVFIGQAATQAEVFRLRAPSLAATEGVTFADAAVAPDGTWSPGSGETVAAHDGAVQVALPAASAVLLTVQ